jgi:hypothetical protein
MRFLPLITLILASPVWAEGFDRPIPQAQSATAEIWFALASVTLLAALWLVHRLVMRK